MAGDARPLAENAARLAHFALEMQRVCEKATAPDGSPVVMRIGLHCGPVVGGIVGGNMLRYQLRDLFLWLANLSALSLRAGCLRSGCPRSASSLLYRC